MRAYTGLPLEYPSRPPLLSCRWGQNNSHIVYVVHRQVDTERIYVGYKTGLGNGNKRSSVMYGY